MSGAPAILATTTLKGPHVDFAGLSPLIAFLGGATLVLMDDDLHVRHIFLNGESIA